MLKPLLSNKELFDLMRRLKDVQRVLICSHRGPDGDALGSSLALGEYLKELGKQVHIIMPNPFPDFLQWLPGSHQVLFYEKHEAKAQAIINNAQMIFCLDFNHLDRINEMGNCIQKSKAERIVIDHHLNPDLNMADFIISHPQMCSTAEVVFRLIYQLGGFDNMNQTAAAAVYTGMMTDTGGFTYNSANPEIYIIISLLLSKGIDKDKIYRNVFNTYSEHRLRLTGYILNEKVKFYHQTKASLFTLTREEMKHYKFIRGDAEGLVNMPLQVKGMRLSISLREDTEKDVIRVSLRSVDDFPCNKMAEEYFNGGGHLNASGGELPFPLEEAIKTAERAIDAYKNLL
jgi:phosphoesterase RecJ-like protein